MLEGTVITTGNLGDIEEIDADLLDVQGYVLCVRETERERVHMCV